MLNFESSTFGYDSEGLTQLINEINIKCIEQTRTSMLNGLNALNQAVDAAWVGDSANRFKEKIDEDAKAIIKAIEAAGEECKNGLQSAGGGMINVDKEISFN